jgi:hypothetical protein
LTVSCELLTVTCDLLTATVNCELLTVNGLTGARDVYWQRRPEAGGGERVITAVPMVSAGATFFFHVDDLPVSGNLPVLAGDAPTGESREADKANETHHGGFSQRHS